jgi:hypothetical protein
VAICTADLTLRDFFLDRRPGPTASEHAGDIAPLVREVIELKDDDVGLAAVHTRMRSEVFDHPSLVVSPFRGCVSKEPCLLGVAILAVVLASVRGEALSAPRLELRLPAPDRRKRLKRLDLVAFRARSHEGERAD